MDTEALIELYLRSAGWTKVFTPDGTGDFSWDHEHVEVFKTTEEAWSLQQDWDDLDADDESRKSEENPHKDDWMQYLDEPDSEPDCED